MRSSFGQSQPSRRSARQANGLVDDDVDYVQGPRYDDGDENDDDDEEMAEDYGSDEDDFCKQRMPEQHPAIRTTVQLYELMDGDRPFLDLNPHYQRNVVWPRKAKKMLIDSMFEGFFVPPVIFNVTQVIDEKGNARYRRTCVDGKQRLTSIRDFMRGKFPWTVAKKDWYYDTPVNDDGTRKAGVSIKRVMPDSQKQAFDKKALVCVEYKDLSQQQEIELFQRVQLGKPLTKAETFRASQGAWQDLAKTFESEYAEVINLCRQNNRASGFWLVLQCFSQIFEVLDASAADGVPRIRNSIPNVERLCSNSAALNVQTKKFLRSIFDRILAIVREDASVFESANYTKAKAFAPVELLSVCSMIAHWGDTRPNGLYRGDIRGLRDRLRQYGGELRGSKECWDICWTYIEDLASIRGTIDGSTTAKGLQATTNWADSAVAVRPGPPVSNPTAPTVPDMGGRRRPSEEDDEFRPNGAAHKPSMTQRKQPKAAPKPKNTTPQVRSKPSSPTNQPFAGHRPVWQPGDNSSSSDDDDDVPSRASAPVAMAAPSAAAASSAPEPVRMGQSSSARKRAIMELGTGNNAALDLEAKKAKLMAGRIKQEKET